MNNSLRSSTAAMWIALVPAFAGCQAPLANRAERIPHGYVYYCDGAGGGGLMNWTGGLRDGLLKGGYPGSGEVFSWNTGLGVIPDQDASVQYKRNKARKLAQEATAYSRRYPQAPVSFMGLSAGTTVVVFALEEMPAGARIDNAVLCGASISSTYDLTRALQNLDNKMYVFTSAKDPVLEFLVPMSGTADRASGTVPAAGLSGFRVPQEATSATRSQYAKVVTIPWRPEFAKLGYAGGHTDVLSSAFVAAHIAPRLTTRVDSAPAALASIEGKVRNPDYERWAAFGEGSYLILEGTQEHQGVRTPVRLKTLLTSKSRDRLMVERQQFLGDDGTALPAQVHSLIAEAWIDPPDHPATDPRTQTTALPAKRITIKGRSFDCPGWKIAAPGTYPDWGSDLHATPYRCPELPGGLAELTLESHMQGQRFKFDGTAVDFNIVADATSR